MQAVIDFLLEYYIWVLAVLIILLITVIGFLADTKKKKRLREKAMNENSNTNPAVNDFNMNQEMNMGYNSQNDSFVQNTNQNMGNNLFEPNMSGGLNNNMASQDAGITPGMVMGSNSSVNMMNNGGVSSFGNMNAMNNGFNVETPSYNDVPNGNIVNSDSFFIPASEQKPVIEPVMPTPVVEPTPVQTVTMPSEPIIPSPVQVSVDRTMQTMNNAAATPVRPVASGISTVSPIGIVNNNHVANPMPNVINPAPSVTVPEPSLNVVPEPIPNVNPAGMMPDSNVGMQNINSNAMPGGVNFVTGGAPQSNVGGPINNNQQ